MRPFNAELANQGNKVITRDGREIRVLCTDAPGELPVVVMDDTGYVVKAYADGRFHQQQEGNYDLFMAPKLRKAWIPKSMLLGLEGYEPSDGFKLHQALVEVSWED